MRPTCSVLVTACNSRASCSRLSATLVSALSCSTRSCCASRWILASSCRYMAMRTEVASCAASSSASILALISARDASSALSATRWIEICLECWPKRLVTAAMFFWMECAVSSPSLEIIVPSLLPCAWRSESMRATSEESASRWTVAAASRSLASVVAAWNWSSSAEMVVRTLGSSAASASCASLSAACCSSSTFCLSCSTFCPASTLSTRGTRSSSLVHAPFASPVTAAICPRSCLFSSACFAMSSWRSLERRRRSASFLRSDSANLRSDSALAAAIIAVFASACVSASPATDAAPSAVRLTPASAFFCSAACFLSAFCSSLILICSSFCAFCSSFSAFCSAACRFCSSSTAARRSTTVSASRALAFPILSASSSAPL
mmetsp:Transcript_57077/g.149937  ORF Transcript_57077/g.149937 Transcript_57077/m.149937 type:complete len:379 (-) Transcript_57077:632-1768(-)